MNGVSQQEPSLYLHSDRSGSVNAWYSLPGTLSCLSYAESGRFWTPFSSDLSKGQGYVSTIAVAPSDPATVYAGTSDGNVQVTTNSGTSWQNVTKSPLPNRYVSALAVSPQ